MFIKLLLFALLIYFIGKTVMNLASAVLQGPQGPPQMPRQPSPFEPPSATPARQEDVEDARWVDL